MARKPHLGNYYAEGTAAADKLIFANSGFAGHLGTWNVLFCDGHVKALKPEATVGSPGQNGNMWGILSGRESSTGACAAFKYGINCDAYSATAAANLAALSAKYE